MTTRARFVMTATAWALVSIFGGVAMAQDARTGVDQLAAQLIKGAPEGRQIRVAVADFPDLQNITNDLGRYIANRLTTRLTQSAKFQVIERQRLSQVLTELRFSMSDLVDPTKAKQLGRMAGVEAIVVGTVSDLGNQVDLDARMIEIETNRMLLGVSTTISRDQVVDDLLKRGREQTGFGQQSVGSPTPDKSGLSGPGESPKGVVTARGFTFLPQGCHRNAGELICTVTFTNIGREEKQLKVASSRYGSSPSRFIDKAGNQWPVEKVEIGRSRGPYWAMEKFLPQLPLNVHFVGKNIPDAVTSISVIVGIDGFMPAPVLRDIPVSR